MGEPWHGNGPCQDCGAASPNWHAPNALWAEVMDCVPGVSTGGFLCPTCFVRHAYEKLGWTTDHLWFLVPVAKSVLYGGSFDLRTTFEAHDEVTEVQPECTCTRQYSGKSQYVNNVGCPLHWKESSL